MRLEIKNLVYNVFISLSLSLFPTNEPREAEVKIMHMRQETTEITNTET